MKTRSWTYLARLRMVVALTLIALDLIGVPASFAATKPRPKPWYSHLQESPVAKENPEVRIVADPDGHEVTISYRTRKWLVYGSNMSGEWSEKPAEEIGPASDGFIISVVMVTKKAATVEQWSGREGGFHPEAIFARQADDGALQRRPYWTDYGGSIDMSDRGLMVNITISYNNRPNKELIQRFAEAIREALMKSAD